MYLCLCTDIRCVQKWIIRKCNGDILTSLIDEKIDVASAFLEVEDVIVICRDVKENERSYELKTSMVDRLDLPEKNTFLRCDKEAAHNYVLHKKIEMNLRNNIDIWISSYLIVEILDSNKKSYLESYLESYVELYEKLKKKMEPNREFEIRKNMYTEYNTKDMNEYNRREFNDMNIFKTKIEEYIQAA